MIRTGSRATHAISTSGEPLTKGTRLQDVGILLPSLSIGPTLGQRAALRAKGTRLGMRKNLFTPLRDEPLSSISEAKINADALQPAAADS